ncbi:cytochrome P450 [Amycolatopsis sp. NPDC051061]|uniref:cytochrome P450 n=1 Tax=Amycolatopsis sp. NPDC051061 TaxID=3155042 RepID=UPI00342675A2
MTETFTEFPAARAAGCPFAPPPALREVAAERPLSRVRLWDGSSPWLITGHAEQRSILSDPRVSMDDKRPGFPHQNAATAENVRHHPQTIFNTDAPEHTRFRRLMTFPFTAKRVEALRPAIQQITDDLIDKMLAGPKPVDLVQAVALPLPTLMICELLGVPYEDHDLFQRNATVAVDRNATAEDNTRANTELVGYLARLITTRMENPGEGWVAELAERVKTGEIDVAGAAQLGVVLLIAGHETSANMIALGTLALLENPDQLDVFRTGDDPKVIAGAVEEMLRYLSIAHHGLRRVATENIEIGGETIRAGEGIIVPLPVANWDGDVFPDPERLDLHRQARQHHAFGFGIHQCVGQQLARVELQVVYSTLYKRIPTLAPATGVDSLRFKDDYLAYGVLELPVTW